MDNLKIRYWFGSILFILSLILLLWAEWPTKPETREIIFQPGEFQVQVPSLDGSGRIPIENTKGVPLAFPDAKKVSLEWTPVVRKGDHSQIRLSFTGSDDSRVEFNYVEDTTNLPAFENLYHFFTVNAEARVELSGLDEKPTGFSGKVLPEDQDLELIWEINPKDEGLYNGIAWLYLQFYPIKEGDLIEQAVSAQSFEIQVVSFLGLNCNFWRVLSVLGIIIGVYIQKKRINWFISKNYKAITEKISKNTR